MIFKVSNLMGNRRKGHRFRLIKKRLISEIELI